MTSVLLLSTPDPGAPPLAEHFASAGFSIVGAGDCAHLVRETLRCAPDVLVCWVPRPTTELLQAVAIVQAQQPVPVLVFTHDPDVEVMRHALEAGVHAWVVQGYARERLRALVHLASAREAQQRELRARVSELTEKLEERKWIDRAKGILMRSQQVSEEQAFQLLRHASMQGNRRVGQLSRQVIDAAWVAEAINRAGQQRMLSQRLVKLFALGCSRTDGPAAAVLLRDTVQRVDANLAALAAGLQKATFGDLVEAAQAGWGVLRALLEGPAEPAALPALDAAAAAVVAQADALVDALEGTGLAAQVHVVNVAGRQRMLSQQTAKLALLRGLAIDPPACDAALAQSAEAFERGLAMLAQAPLSTAEIRAILDQGRTAWAELQGAVPAAAQAAGRMKLAAASEELLEVFDRLTAAYQHSVEVLIG